MGTRINYEVMGDEPGDPPSCILYSKNSDPTHDCEATFRAVVLDAAGPTDLVERLLGFRYREARGAHRKGDRIFTIDTAPGHRDFVLRVRGKTVWREDA